MRVRSHLRALEPRQSRGRHPAHDLYLKLPKATVCELSIPGSSQMHL